ncbi:MAG: ATP synthase F1 subunit delta [Acidobacteria bacterium]|nr:ATP synthase F1 subunit delta [Acidobacteriota bacterium]
MTHSAVAMRYANALADVVTGAGMAGAEAALAELRAFEAVLAGSAELHNALTSPAVPPSRKRAVVGRIADTLKLSRTARNFLFVLIDHRRIAALNEIIHSFETVSDERLGFARADVTSARPLSEGQRGAVIAQLERLSGKRIRARYSVDEALVGGVVASIGSTVYDGSVRGRLETLGRRLATE